MSEFRYYRPSNFPPIVKNLIIINVLVFLAQLTLEKTYQVTERFMLYPILPAELKKILGLDAVSSYQQFQPYQIFTHMFSHSPSFIFHVIFNMLVLWMFGRVLENVWGPKRFLFFYLACGLGAAALHLGVQYFRAEQLLQALQSGNPFDMEKLGGALAPALGASGAIMGIMAAFAYLFPNTPLILFPFPVPIKAKWLVLGYVALDLFGGIGNISGDNIAHFAHLGGAITGFIIVYIWNKTNRRTLY
jgi:membrane associated rhomboid family serine protease